MTQSWAKVKGQTEAALRTLGTTYPSLKPYSVRPALVDPTFQPEIKQYLGRTTARTLNGYLSGPMRSLWPSMVSPTKDLGRVLCDLALGDGQPIEGKGVSGEGRTISNVAVRRMAGL